MAVDPNSRLPNEDPKIEGVQASYSVGSYVTANCTSSPSYPPARMDWFINGVKAQQWFLDYYYSDKPISDLNLESRTIGLKFQADSSHFHQNEGYLSLVCLATVADLTRTSENKAYLTRLTKEKFAQQFTNYHGRIKAEFLLLVVLVVVIHL
ncbi:hypothetical protein RUM43_007863 [Polyplax serrata]|uniref:Ig-like domain-containing protein n=1 Tax=Polyplax serrata TaxID=468196 RepID=A0AAN8P9G2_POLSC